MANFNTHLNTAAVVSGVLSASLMAFNFIDIKTSFYCFFAGIIGGILPDIDHEKGIPIRILKFIIANIVAFLVIIAFSNLKPLILIGIWIGVYLFFEILFFIFKKITTHRGIIHSIPMGFLFGFLTTIFLYKFLHFNVVKAYYIGVFIIIGFLTHLILDEIYSVDFTGKRIKKSFGSAFKLFSKNRFANLIIYSILIALFVMLPKKEEFLSILKGILKLYHKIKIPII